MRGRLFCSSKFFWFCFPETLRKSLDLPSVSAPREKGRLETYFFTVFALVETSLLPELCFPTTEGPRMLSKAKRPGEESSEERFEVVIY